LLPWANPYPLQSQGAGSAPLIPGSQANDAETVTECASVNREAQ